MQALTTWGTAREKRHGQPYLCGMIAAQLLNSCMEREDYNMSARLPRLQVMLSH